MKVGTEIVANATRDLTQDNSHTSEAKELFELGMKIEFCYSHITQKNAEMNNMSG